MICKIQNVIYVAIVKVNYFQSSIPNQDILHIFWRPATVWKNQNKKWVLILGVNISKLRRREIQVALVCQKKVEDILIWYWTLKIIYLYQSKGWESMLNGFHIIARKDNMKWEKSNRKVKEPTHCTFLLQLNFFLQRPNRFCNLVQNVWV